MCGSLEGQAQEAGGCQSSEGKDEKNPTPIMGSEQHTNFTKQQLELLESTSFIRDPGAASVMLWVHSHKHVSFDQMSFVM